MKGFLSLTVSLVLIICVFSACNDNRKQYITNNNASSEHNSTPIDTSSTNSDKNSSVSDFDPNYLNDIKEDFLNETNSSAQSDSFIDSNSSNNSNSSNETNSSNESETVSKEEEFNQNEDKESTEELVGVNKLRPDYDLGNCRDLSGDITVIVFYLDDFESNWTAAEINNFTEKEIKPGLKFLEDSAQKFGISLNLKIEEVHSSIYYDDKVEEDIKASGYATIDTLYTAARSLGYKSDKDFISKYEEKYSTEVICYCVFNKEGGSYALNPKRGSDVDIAEHVLIFAYDAESTGYEPVGWQSSVVAHETLHLYGAEDYYKPAERKALAQKYCPNDIMLSCKYFLLLNDFGDATAFYIGWTDVVPAMLYEENW